MLSRLLLILSSLFISLSASAQFGQLTLPPRELGCDLIDYIQKRFVQDHIIFDKLDTNLEHRAVNQYIEKLDPSKMYLLESDAEQIKKSMAGIFTRLKNKDCQPILSAWDIYKKRVTERVGETKKLLNPKFKFNKEAKVLLDPKKRSYAKNKEEANKFNLDYLQFQMASYIATDTPESEAKEKLQRSYERILKRVNDTKEKDIYAVYLDAFAQGLDPHSSFFSKEAIEDFEINMRLSLEGIGATLSSKDGFTVIENLVPGGSAYRSTKLQPKDMIMAVAQGDDKFEDVVEMDLQDVVRKIRGPKGTKVRLSVLRKKSKQVDRFTVDLIRDKVVLEEEAAAIDYVEKEFNGKKRKIGLIYLPSFYADNRKGGRSAAKDMKKLLAEANKKNVSAIVLDLSMNGGGSLEDAVDIAGLFFKTGNVVKQSQRGPDKGEITLEDEDPAVDWAGPLVLNISRISASASEIVAGTLKDYKRALIVGGDHTFGKGSVQQVSQLMQQKVGALKTTIGMFFTAGGRSTQHAGVTSDISFPSAYSTDEIGEKNLEYSLPPKAIKSFLSPSAYVTTNPGKWDLITPEIVTNLKKKSEERVAKSPDFKKVVEEIKKAKERGKYVRAGDLLEDSKEKEKDKKPEDETKVKTAEQREKERWENFLKRADIQESLNIAYDLVDEMAGPKVTVGQQLHHEPEKESEVKQ